MDRLDAMRVLVLAVDQGSLAGAGRVLNRSPAAISRAIAFLEAYLGVELLHRTTRGMRLSTPGERYVAACRKILDDLDHARLHAAGERALPNGLLTISAPPIAGEEVLRPIIDAFLTAFPSVNARVLLLDRWVNLVDEGVDVALRIGKLPDSSLVAIKVGDDIRRVVAAAPRYLAAHPRIEQPGDITRHQIVAMANFGIDSWTFSPAPGATMPRIVHFIPRIVVNSVRAAISSTVDGLGLTRLYSYHLADRIRDGDLQIVLPDLQQLPLPAHVIAQPFRLSVPKVRAFVDFAVPRLRTEFARLAREAGQLEPGGTS